MDRKPLFAALPALMCALTVATPLALAQTAPSSPRAAAERPEVGMGELRDLIEQRIAEVRAQRASTPAVVQVKGAPRTPTRGKARRGAAGVPVASAEPVATPALVAATTPDLPQAPGKTGLLGREVSWAYAGDTGPGNWGLLKPEYRACLVGLRQSPIDLRDGIPVELEPIEFAYQPSAFEVRHRHHTVQSVPEAGNAIVLRGQRFALRHVEFRHPGEVVIDGRQAPMSIHLFHEDAEGQMAVVAVPVQLGEPNAAVQQVWNNLPLERDLTQRASAPIDLLQFLPVERHYLTYMGSLSMPPCTEGVLWAVMKQPLTVSVDQMAVLARLYPHNARPIQPTHGRLIKDGR